MKRMAFVLVAVVAILFVVDAPAPTFQPVEEAAAAIDAGKLSPSYRDWRLISVAREEGDLDNIRAILGNDVANKACRETTRSRPSRNLLQRKESTS
jgi:hypothetical protein